MEQITTLITTLGFPIVACVALGYFIKDTTDKTRQETRADKENLYKTLTELTNTNTSLVKTNEEIARTNQFLANDLKNNIKDIDNKLDKALRN